VNKKITVAKTNVPLTKDKTIVANRFSMPCYRFAAARCNAWLRGAVVIVSFCFLAARPFLRLYLSSVAATEQQWVATQAAAAERHNEDTLLPVC
jgi:hypothetical protein